MTMLEAEKLIAAQEQAGTRQRKTRDRYDIETNYGYGWEAEDCEYTLAAAQARLAEYRENACGRYIVRMTKHREAITKEAQA